MTCQKSHRKCRAGIGILSHCLRPLLQSQRTNHWNKKPGIILSPHSFIQLKIIYGVPTLCQALRRAHTYCICFLPSRSQKPCGVNLAIRWVPIQAAPGKVLGSQGAQQPWTEEMADPPFLGGALLSLPASLSLSDIPEFSLDSENTVLWHGKQRGWGAQANRREGQDHLRLQGSGKEASQRAQPWSSFLLPSIQVWRTHHKPHSNGG